MSINNIVDEVEQMRNSVLYSEEPRANKKIFLFLKMFSLCLCYSSYAALSLEQLLNYNRSSENKDFSIIFTNVYGTISLLFIVLFLYVDSVLKAVKISKKMVNFSLLLFISIVIVESYAYFTHLDYYCTIKILFLMIFKFYLDSVE